jgi:hypothetical protein
MARAQEENRSLRFSRAEIARLVVALLLSALLHLTLWGAYHAVHRLDWWQKLHLPSWRHLQAQTTPKQGLTKPADKPRPEEEEPTIFVDVSQADADAPEKTKYYSDRSSRAANPDVANANAPKFDGRQRDMAKLEDASRLVKAPAAAAAQPSPESPAVPPQQQSAANQANKPPELATQQPSPTPAAETPADLENVPPPTLTPGETDPRPKQGKANSAPTTEARTAQTPRPRTIRQALAQQDQIPGRKMQQEGGVARRALSSSLDVKGTPFGEYDRALVEAISQRWYDLLDRHRFSDDRTGKVTLHFKLKPDGTVIEVQTVENTVGELLGYLCQESIEEASPFAKWPPDMVRMVGANYRELTFTFYYY